MVHENRNLAGRLIGLIESHAEQLTQRTVENLRTSPRTPSYRTLSIDELHGGVYSVYHDLGYWLLEKTDSAIQSRYNKLGEVRFRQGVPLREILWAMVLTKNDLRSYLSAWSMADSAVELYRQREFDHLIGQFFDRAMVYTTEGYERMRDGASRTSDSDSAEREDPADVHVARHEQSQGGWIL